MGNYLAICRKLFYDKISAKTALKIAVFTCKCQEEIAEKRGGDNQLIINKIQRNKLFKVF
jgi:hypothetical protein